MAKGTAKNLAIGTIVAAVAGYVAGILTAPKSGKETRADIKDAADRTLASAEKELKQLHTQMGKTLTEAKRKLDKASGTSKKQLSEAIDKTTAAKEKARVLLSAIHEGDIDDKDLKKALTEAAKSLDHLKSFLTK